MTTAVASLMYYIVKRIDTIASGMNAVVNGCIRLCFPIMYNGRKVSCSNRGDGVAFDSGIVEYDGASRFLIAVYFTILRTLICLVYRKIDLEYFFIVFFMSQFHS